MFWRGNQSLLPDVAFLVFTRLKIVEGSVLEASADGIVAWKDAFAVFLSL